jgi:ectoine hydroxylase-related dioxygenase (phytanoyl-CoA dioxygenase family)
VTEQPRCPCSLNNRGWGYAAAEPLGTDDLSFAPVPLERGCMVLWDSTVPHHNLSAAAANRRARLSAYLDMAPADRGIYAPPAVQTANQTERLLRSQIGSADAPENAGNAARLGVSGQSLSAQHRWVVSLILVRSGCPYRRAETRDSRVGKSAARIQAQVHHGREVREAASERPAEGAVWV